MDTVVVDARLMAYTRFHRGKNILGLTADVANLISSKVGNGPFRIVFALDYGKSKRAEFYPQYKEHRKARDKAKGKEYQKKLEIFNTEYNKLKDYLKNFGHSVAIWGVEADDIASILAHSSLVKTGKLYLLSSDSDWVKFVKNPNTYIINPTKNLLVSYSSLKEVYGYTAYEKLVMDCLIGVPKENVPGLRRFGPKTFFKILDEVGGDLGEVLGKVESIYNGSNKIPEPFSTVREMYDFNVKLFKPWTINDLTDEEQKLLFEALEEKPFKNIEKIYNDSVTMFGSLYLPTSVEEKVYGL